MNIEEFPSLEEIKLSIERLKASFKKLNTNKTLTPTEYSLEINNAITNEIGFNFSPLKLFKTSKFNFDFFRARPVKDITNRDLFTEYSYPPIAFTKSGRCNLPNKPVFYCSNNPIISLLEIARNNTTQTEDFYLAKWSLINSENNLAFQSFLQPELHKENIFKGIRDDINSRISEPFMKSLKKDLSESQKKAIIYFLKYIEEVFINDTDYIFSSSFADNSLFAPHNFRTDILMYPSVQSELMGVNMALNPNFVDNNLKLERVYRVSINKVDILNGTSSLTIKDYGTVTKNVIIWKKITPENTEYTELLKEDFPQSLNKTKYNKNN